MHMCEIAVNLFRILWMLQQMVDGQHRARRWGWRNIHWLIGTLLYLLYCAELQYFVYFHIWLYYAHSYLFLIFFIGLQVSMKLLDLLFLGHSNIHLGFSIFQTIDFRALVLIWNMLRIIFFSDDTLHDVIFYQFWGRGWGFPQTYP